MGFYRLDGVIISFSLKQMWGVDVNYFGRLAGWLHLASIINR